MAKSLKYWFEWRDVENTLFKEEIWVEGFAGTAEELKAGSEPLIKIYNKDVGEKYLGGIVPFVATVSAKSSSTFKATEFSGENYGDAILKHKQGATTLFNAIIVPFEGMDDDLDNGFFKVQLSAECGLNYLKSIDFVPTKTRKTLLNIINVCVLNLPYIETFGYYVVDNTTTNDGTATGLNYFDTFIDDRQFELMNCYDVIKAIIQEYGQFVFSDGRWNITNISNISKEDSTFRIYNSALTLTSSGAYTRPTKAIRRLGGGQFGRLFSQQSVKVEKKASVKRALNVNSDFATNTDWTFVGLASILFEIANGKLSNKGNTYYSSPTSTPDTSYVQSPPSLYYPFTDRFTTADKQKINIAIKSTKGFSIKNLRLQIIAVQNGVLGGGSTEVFYLTNENTWYRGVSGVSTPFFYADIENNKEKIIDIPQVPNIVFNTTALQKNIITGFGEFLDYPYLAASTDLPYNLYVRVYMPERFHDTYVLAPALIEFVTEIDYINVSVVDVKSEISNGFIKHYGLEKKKDRDLDFTINLGVGFPSYPIGHDSLFRDDSTLTQISLFNGIKLEEHISNAYLSVLGSRLQFYSGTVQGDVEFSDLLLIDSLKYRLHNLEQNFRMRQHTIKGIALNVNVETTYNIVINPLDLKIDVESIRRSVEEQLKKTYGDILGTKFVDKNLEIGLLGNGQSSLRIKNDFRVDKLYSQEMLLRATGDGLIKDVATPTSSNFTLTKPAKTGTYALLDDIDTLSWRVGGNTITAERIFGTTSGNFDIQVLRNNAEVGKWIVGGLRVPLLNISGLTANEIVGTDVNKNLVSLAVATYPSLTELTYLKGVTSSIQTQLNLRSIDTAVVHIAGTETITGAKTFSADVQIPAIPINATSATSKSYIDNLLTGITWKNEVRVATTVNIVLSGLQTIDGIVEGTFRVLVKNQTNQTENGLYDQKAGDWTRVLDADTAAELETATVAVRSGTANRNTQWTCTASGVVLGTTNITFGQISGAGTYTNGAGITLTGNVFAIDTAVVVTLTGVQTLSNKTFVAPHLGTPLSGVMTNVTGTAAGLTAGNVTTNANLTGEVTSIGNATTVLNATVIGKILTGYVSGVGIIAATDTILQAIQKLNANDATNANLTGIVTSVGNATSIADAALSIAKTSGLQTALDSKFTTPSALTTNYLPKWNGSAFANSQIFDNGTNVGIGTPNPRSKLQVSGGFLAVQNNQTDAINAFGSTATVSLALVDSGAEGRYRGGSIGFGGLSTGATSPYLNAVIKGGKDTITAGTYGGYLGFWTMNEATSGASTERMRIDSSGNVLIATTASVDASKLQVNGPINQRGFTSQLTYANASGTFVAATATNVADLLGTSRQTGQVLTWDGTTTNFMDIINKPIKVNAFEVVVGNEFGVLESRNEFTFKEGYLKVANKIDATRNITFGMLSPFTYDAGVTVTGGGQLHLNASKVRISDLGGSTITERVVTVDGNGVLSAKVLTTTGTTSQGLTDVLNISNVALNKGIVFNQTDATIDSTFVHFNFNSTLSGYLTHYHNSSINYIQLRALNTTNIEIISANGNITIAPTLTTANTILGLGVANNRLVLNGTSFALHFGNNAAGVNSWGGNLGTQSVPSNGDVIIFAYNSTLGSFVMRTVNRRLNTTYDATKTYLTID